MLKHEECLPIERLREMFDLDYETGQLTWRERPLHHFCHDKEKRRWNTRYAGKDICRTSGAKDDAWTYLTVNINATKFFSRLPKSSHVSHPREKKAEPDFAVLLSS